MTNDILIIKKEHWIWAERILYMYGDRLHHRPVITIGGPSGSGKSVLSYCISKLLKKKSDTNVKIISLDDYYQVPPDLRAAWRSAKGVDAIGRNEIDWFGVNLTINDFIHEQKSYLPSVDLITNKIDTLIVKFDQYDTLIIEGAYACNVTSRLSVYLDAGLDWSIGAQELRNKETMDCTRLAIMTKEREEALSTRSKADIIITQEDLGSVWCIDDV